MIDASLLKISRNYFLGETGIRELKTKANVIIIPSHYKRFRKIYLGMLRRCFVPKCKHFKEYGGRGITVCESWKESKYNFFMDMYDSYCNSVMVNGVKNTTLERINNDKGYSLDNCKWATMKEQSNNKRKYRTRKRKEVN